MGDTCTLQELARLIEILRADPSSALAAAIEGWTHPVSREAAILMDLWDLEAIKSGAKKPPKYERPWKSAASKQHLGDAPMSRDELDARLGRTPAPAPPV